MNEAFQRMTKARIKLIANQPFFGVLALRLKMEERTDLPLPTLATDGKHLFFHPEWVMGHSLEVVEAGVAHEIGHCVLQHIARRNGREPRRWNVAIDHAVNNMLAECGFKIEPNWLCDPKYKEWSAEAIYNDLPAGDSNQPSQPNFDEHVDGETEIEADWETATIQAANSEAARKNGKLPSQIRRFMTELHAPKVDWRAVLRRFATASAAQDFVWSRPNRKMLSLGIILPGLYSEAVEDMTCCIDTSGSITDEQLTAFGSEIADIRVSARPNTTRVMYCDAAVNHVDEFLPDDYFHVDPHGGGGTDFRPPFKRLKELDARPSCFVYLTDGYGSFPKEPPPYPVLWLMTTDVQPPWGEVVRLEL